MFGMGRSRTTEEASSTVGRGPVPRRVPVYPKNVRGGQAPALRSCTGDRPPRDGIGRLSLRARTGTGFPRPTGYQTLLFLVHP